MLFVIEIKFCFSNIHVHTLSFFYIHAKRQTDVQMERQKSTFFMLSDFVEINSTNNLKTQKNPWLKIFLFKISYLFPLNQVNNFNLERKPIK